MNNLQFHLLGQFQVICNEKPVTAFGSDKVRALLSYLIAEAHCPHRREILADLFWPDKTEVTARANLRRALSNLRAAIGDHEAEPAILLISRQTIQFNPNSHTWVDVHRLNDLYAQEKTTPENIHMYDAVLELYKGEFLAGFSLIGSMAFDEWLIMTREQWARKAAILLTRASRYYEALQNYDLALPFAWRLVELEPWQESARRQLMRLLAISGQRDEALLQYQILENALQNDLSIEPEPQTRQLYKQIKSGDNQILQQLYNKSDQLLISVPEFLQQEIPTSSTVQESFVARREELAQLDRILKLVISGQGSLAFVSGEAGSGKTMLIREYIQQAQVKYPELMAATGSCNAFTGIGDPYLPFREILSQLSGDVKTQWKAGSISRDYAIRLWEALPSFLTAILRHGQDLIGTLISAQSLQEQASAIAATDPDLFQTGEELVQQKVNRPGAAPSQMNLFTQYVNLLQDMAKERPLLLVLDDLQWADKGTIGLLFYLGKHLAGSRIMLLGAYRSEEVSAITEDERHPLAPVLSELKRDFGDIFIDLEQSLKKEFLRELLASEPNELKQSFHDSLFKHTDGHALFTVEMLRDMQESGALIKNEHGVWVMKSEFQLEKLPARIEGIIGERIARLPQKLQRILTLASIEGEVFTAEYIAELEGIPVSELVSILSNQLDRQHRLVRAQQISWQGDQSRSTYRYRHFLFQKFMYDRLDEIEQAGLHLKVGNVMEAMAGDNLSEYSVSLARHFDKANQFEKAETYYSRAGERALGMSAFSEAISHFQNALRLLLCLPMSAQRDKKELGLQLQLGLAYQPIMGFANEKVGQAYQRAWELSPHVDDPIKVVTTLHLLFSYYANMAEFDTANEIMALLEQNYRELGEEYADVALLSLGWGYGYLDSLLGRIESAYKNFEQALALYNPDKLDSLSQRLGMETGIYCHGWTGLHAAWMGYPDQAKAHIQAALKIAEDRDSKLFSNDALFFSTWISLELEDIAAAREYSEVFLELTTKEHYFLFESVARAFKGRVLSRERKHQEAIQSIQKGLDMFHTTGMVMTHTIFLHALAEAYCADGQAEDGLKVILKTEQVEQETGETREKAALQRIKGDLYLLMGNETAAEEAYLSAVATAQEQSAKLLELEAIKRLARLWHRQGKVNQAKQILHKIYDWFTEGFDTQMLVEAKALIDQLK